MKKAVFTVLVVLFFSLSAERAEAAYWSPCKCKTGGCTCGSQYLCRSCPDDKWYADCTPPDCVQPFCTCGDPYCHDWIYCQSICAGSGDSEGCGNPTCCSGSHIEVLGDVVCNCPTPHPPVPCTWCASQAACSACGGSWTEDYGYCAVASDGCCSGCTPPTNTPTPIPTLPLCAEKCDSIGHLGSCGAQTYCAHNTCRNLATGDQYCTQRALSGQTYDLSANRECANCRCYDCSDVADCGSGNTCNLGTCSCEPTITPIPTATPTTGGATATPTGKPCCATCSGNECGGTCGYCTVGYCNNLAGDACPSATDTPTPTGGGGTATPTNTPTATRTPTPSPTSTPTPTGTGTVPCGGLCSRKSECRDAAADCIVGECHNPKLCYTCVGNSSYKETATCDCGCFVTSSASSTIDGQNMIVSWDAVVCCNGGPTNYTVSACGQSFSTAGTSLTFTNCGQSASFTVETNCCPPPPPNPPVDCWCDGGSCGASCTMRVHNPQSGIKCDASYCVPTPTGPTATPTTSGGTITPTPTKACCAACSGLECSGTCSFCTVGFCDNAGGTACITVTPTIVPTTRPTSTPTATPTPKRGMCAACSFDGQCLSGYMCWGAGLCRSKVCIPNSGSITDNCRACFPDNSGGPGGCPGDSGPNTVPDQSTGGDFIPVEDYYWNTNPPIVYHYDEEILRTEVENWRGTPYDSLIKFDLSKIKSGSTIVRAVLRLFFKDVLDDEGKNRQAGVQIDGPEGYIKFCCSHGYHYATIDETNSDNHYDVTQMVQKWVDDPSSNNGFLLSGTARGTIIGSSRLTWDDADNPTPMPTHCELWYPGPSPASPCLPKPTGYNRCGIFGCWNGCSSACETRVCCTDLTPIPTAVPPGTLTNNARPFLMVDYILSSKDWFQTKDLNVLTTGSIASQIPVGEYFSQKGTNSSGVIVYDGSVAPQLKDGQVAEDSKNWVAKSPYEGGKLGFSYLLNRLKVDTSQISSGDLSQKPAAGTYYYNNSLQITTADWQVNAGEKTVIFVDGNVNVNRNLTVSQGGFLAIIASGDIIFDKTVTKAQGIFSADGIISIKGNEEGDANPKVQFLGQGSFIGWKGFGLGRTVADPETTPAEKFESRPDLWVNFPLEFAYTNNFREEELP